MANKTTKYHILSCPVCPLKNERFDTSSLEEHLGKYHLNNFGIYSCTGCRENFSSTYRAHRHMEKCPYVKEKSSSLQLLNVKIEDLRKIHHWVNVAVKNHANLVIPDASACIRNAQQTIECITTIQNRIARSEISERLITYDTEILPNTLNAQLGSGTQVNATPVIDPAIISSRPSTDFNNNDMQTSIFGGIVSPITAAPSIEAAPEYLSNDLEIIRSRSTVQLADITDNNLNIERPSTPINKILPLRHSTPKKSSDLNSEQLLFFEEAHNGQKQDAQFDDEVFNPPEKPPLPFFSNNGTQPYYDVVGTMRHINRIQHTINCTEGGSCSIDCPKYKKLQCIIEEYPSFYNQCLIFHSDVAKSIQSYFGIN